MTNTNNRRLQVYSVKDIWDKETGEKNSIWVKAGSAWINRDGSINVYLDVLPIDGKLHVRDAAEDKKAAPEGNPNRNQQQTNDSPSASLSDSMGGH